MPTEPNLDKVSSSIDWFQFLNTRGAVFESGATTSFGENPADYDALLQENVLYDLSDLGVLALNGPDSAKFLQGQTTADFDLLSELVPLYGAFCNLQGRVLCDFTAVLPKADHILLVLPKALITTVLEEKAKYAAFFKTELSDASKDYRVLGLSGPTVSSLIDAQFSPAPEEALINASRFTEAGMNIVPTPLPTDLPDGISANKAHVLTPRFTLLVPAERACEQWGILEKGTHQLGLPAWHLLDIRAAIAHIYSLSSTQFLPQALDYHIAGGISFTKGCYTGQEIVARMYYRGKVKKRLCHLALTMEEAPPPGAEIYLPGSDKSQGQIVIAAPSGALQCEALALLSLDLIKTLEESGQSLQFSLNTQVSQPDTEDDAIAARLLTLPYVISDEVSETE